MASISQFRVIAVLGLLCGLTPFAIDMYLPAIATIASEVNSNTEYVQLTISAYLIAFSICQLGFGPISDSIGRRPIAIAGLAIFFVASIWIANSTSVSQLMLLRLLQGLGGAAVTVAIMATLRDLYSGNALAKMTSYLMMVMAIAPMIAPIIGAQVLYFYDWHAIFYCLAILAVIAWALYLLTLSESLAPENRNRFKPDSVLKAYRHVLSDKPSWRYLLINALSSAPLFIFISTSPHIYMEFLGVSPQHYAYYFALNVVFLMFHSWLNTRLLRHWGYQRILPVAVNISLLPAAVLLAAGILTPIEHLLKTIVPLIALTIGLGSLISANAYAGMLTRHPNNAGSAAAISGVARFGFGALIGAIVNLLSTGDHVSMIVSMSLMTALSALIARVQVKE